LFKGENMEENHGPKIIMQLMDYDNRRDFAIVEKRFGKRYVAKPLEFELVEHIIERPTFFMPGGKNNMQQLFDQLYREGLRPTVLKDEPGALKAVSYHLEDMRRLVFQPEVVINKLKD
jgi:hypothetical protein